MTDRLQGLRKMSEEFHISTPQQTSRANPFQAGGVSPFMFEEAEANAEQRAEHRAEHGEAQAASSSQADANQANQMAMMMQMMSLMQLHAVWTPWK